MAYSRWVDSDWYIFWSTDSGTVPESQVLDVWHANGIYKDFTYAELTDDSFNLEKEFPSVQSYSDAVESIKKFIVDVNKEFDGWYDAEAEPDVKWYIEHDDDLNDELCEGDIIWVTIGENIYCCVNKVTEYEIVNPTIPLSVEYIKRGMEVDSICIYEPSEEQKQALTEFLKVFD